MLGTFRTQSGFRHAAPRAGGFRACAAATLLVAACEPAAAQDGTPPSLLDAIVAALAILDRHEIAALGLTLGILLFAVLVAIMLVRARTRADDSEAAARDQIIALKAEIDRANALLLSDPQIVVAWAAASDEPEILGDVSLVTDAAAPHRVLAFGTWLDPETAQAIERAVDALRERGESFSKTLTTPAGRFIEAEGRAIGGQAVLRLRDVGGAKRALAEMTERHEKLAAEADSLRTLIGALPAPVWVRDRGGKLVYVNPAYARAVDATNEADAAARGLELLASGSRDDISRVRNGTDPFAARLPAIVTGARRTFDVLDVATARGSAGIAVEATEVETLHAELARMQDAHRRALDQLATAVAVFNADRKLIFHNTAYRALWDLDAAFLDQAPADSAVLDRLRAARKLPEEQDYRAWKTKLHEAYQAIDVNAQEWHLPDGRTLRVVTTPNPEGGITYLFEDVTERLELARRYDSLIRVQRETLDNLAEGVAVFGSDGRLRLHNPAFARLWRLDAAALVERPHVETVIEWCRKLHADDDVWRVLHNAVTAIENREPVSGLIERRDGTMLECATVPLPDGATLVTFQDLTDTINVERALRERTDALEAADRIKVKFVQHVSYELRSPLTNIIGFAHFLGDPATGPLNARQNEYLGYITVSTNALLAIINNILDLATIDAGAMALNLGPVDVRSSIEAAAEGVQDRLVKNDIKLDLRASPHVGSFVADERRLRQILFNLLANAVSFSPTGGTVTLAADRREDAIVFSVTDSGPGIPEEMKGRVFEWFETNPLGSQHRGTGLGLSLVRSFVNLHGGAVELDSDIGRGTTVICTFPLAHDAERSAA